MTTRTKEKQSLSKTMGLLPPQAVPIEKYILGSILMEGNLNRVTDILQPDSFYNNQHHLIYEAMLTLYRKNKPIDILTVLAQLTDTGKLEEAGGDFYLSQLSNGVFNESIEGHARYVEEKAIARRSIAAMTQGIQSLYAQDDEDLIDKLTTVDASLFAARKSFGAQKNVDPKGVAADLKAHIELGMVMKGLTGYTTGIRALDHMTGGLQKQSLVTIGARTRHGKSAIAAAMLYAAAKDGTPSVFFSMEMRQIELLARMACIKLKEDLVAYCKEQNVPIGNFRVISYSRFFRGNITEEEKVMVFKAIDDVSDLPIIIDDTPSLNTLQIKSKLIKYMMDYDVKIAVVDYIQLAEISETKHGNRAEGISQTMTDLKNMCKLFDMPILVLSQGDRGAEKGPGRNHQMTLTDLKGSGGIEEKSDMVFLLYRPEVADDEPVNANGESDRGFMYIDVAKNKMGQTGEIRIAFDVATNYLDPDYDDMGLAA